MGYKKGERVRHPTKEDWGLGEILEDSRGDRVRIFFVGVGEKTLSLQHIEPVRVVGDESHHPVLDNLRIAKSQSGIKYQSLPHSIEVFLEQFPEGFYGTKFIESERDDKEKACALSESLLGEDAFRTLLDMEQYDEITKRALKLVNKTNLIFPNEKMALKDGLQNPDSRQGFSQALFSLLYGNGLFEERFMTFASLLENIGAAKWTTATYFPFFAHPKQHMFVKPTISQHAAEVCGWDLNYKPQLNWLTYKKVLDLSSYLFDQLSELKPRDMIDVQSFMWCIAPGTYKDS